MIAKQKNNKSLDQLASKLKERLQDCNLQAVTAKQHRKKMMGDVFIRAFIRQRLQEEELHFQEVQEELHP